MLCDRRASHAPSLDGATVTRVKLQRTGRETEVVEVGQPAKSVNGHQLVAPNVLVSFLPCICDPAKRGDRG